MGADMTRQVHMLKPQDVEEIRRAVADQRVRRGERPWYYAPGWVYGEIDVITGSGRAVCRACGRRIAKGERALKIGVDFTGHGSWTVIEVQIHDRDCLEVQ
jgi:hypothetical protein